VKSAYRKLARLRQPRCERRVPNGRRRNLALLSKAYHVLIDAEERVYHDQQLDAQSSPEYSILHSNNPTAQRARNLAVQARWDRVVNEVLEKDRSREQGTSTRGIHLRFAIPLNIFRGFAQAEPVWTGSTLPAVALYFHFFDWRLATWPRDCASTLRTTPIFQNRFKIRSWTMRNPEQPFTRFYGFRLSTGWLCRKYWGGLLNWLGACRDT